MSLNNVIAVDAVRTPVGLLSDAYFSVKISGRRIRRLVDDPAVIADTVPPLVQLFLSSARNFCEVFDAVSHMAGYGELRSWVATMQNQLRDCEASTTACAAAAASTASFDPDAAALRADCYQHFARLYNNCVDSVDEVQATRRKLLTEQRDPSVAVSYRADLGEWECGIVCDFKAFSKEEAYTVAKAELARARGAKRLADNDDQMVVQIYCYQNGRYGRLIYDFMHGFYD